MSSISYDLVLIAYASSGCSLGMVGMATVCFPSNFSKMCHYFSNTTSSRKEVELVENENITQHRNCIGAQFEFYLRYGS